MHPHSQSHMDPTGDEEDSDAEDQIESEGSDHENYDDDNDDASDDGSHQGSDNDSDEEDNDGDVDDGRDGAVNADNGIGDLAELQHDHEHHEKACRKCFLTGHDARTYTNPVLVYDNCKDPHPHPAYDPNLHCLRNSTSGGQLMEGFTGLFTLFVHLPKNADMPFEPARYKTPFDVDNNQVAQEMAA
ncbi:hypothetical protein ACHAPJ_006989 [Fusarium lateritium]